MLAIRIPLGRNKVAEWSIATLLRRLIKIGYVKPEYAKSHMMVAMQNEMAKMAQKKRKRGVRLTPSELKQQAIKSLGNSGMELWDYLGLNESHLYDMAYRAAQAK